MDNEMNHQMQYQQAPDFLSKEEVELLKRTLLAQFPDDEKETFVRICQRTRLDPFTKQIYATKRYQKTRQRDGTFLKVPTLVPVTGIMGLKAVAVRTGRYDGCEVFWCGKDGVWRADWVSNEYPEAAKAIIYHKDRTHPEVGIARWTAYVGQTYNYDTKKWEISDFWHRMSDWMLSKCAQAQGLRGAFPDPLSNLYIHEELESEISESETEAIPSDEAKVAESQRKDEELKKAGTKFVDMKPASRPSPQEALEPAFEEDKPAPPPPSRPKQQQQPAPAQPAPVSLDELDMGPPPPKDGKPKAEATVPPLTTEPVDGTDTPPTEDTKPEPAWKTHVILGVAHAKFNKRKVGDLNAAELNIIESQWLPEVRRQWDDASDAQRADAAAFESAIAYQKMVKPW
jgi:phage recombination protein Bet